MRRLVVNADDFGADRSRNAGIAEGVAAGVVTSVSLLANGPALDDALLRLRRIGGPVSLGAHLNLSEGRPLADGLRLLVGPDGLFHGKAAARALLHRRGDPALEAEISRELEAQFDLLERLTAPLGGLDHVDGHQHVHVFPAVLRAANAAAARRAIAWFRVPDEPWPPSGLPPGREGAEEELRAFAAAAREARSALRGRLPRAADHFRGLFVRCGADGQAFADIAAALPEGLTELMVHPGRAARPAEGSSFSRFSTSERKRELDALRSAAFRSGLEVAGALLTRFPRSAPPACAS